MLCPVPEIFELVQPEDILLWTLMLRNNSSLFNGVILLLRERRKKKNKMKIEKETGFLKDLTKVPSV